MELKVLYEEPYAKACGPGLAPNPEHKCSDFREVEIVSAPDNLPTAKLADEISSSLRIEGPISLWLVSLTGDPEKFQAIDESFESVGDLPIDKGTGIWVQQGERESDRVLIFEKSYTRGRDALESRASIWVDGNGSLGDAVGNCLDGNKFVPIGNVYRELNGNVTLLDKAAKFKDQLEPGSIVVVETGSAIPGSVDTAGFYEQLGSAVNLRLYDRDDPALEPITVSVSSRDNYSKLHKKVLIAIQDEFTIWPMWDQGPLKKDGSNLAQFFDLGNDIKAYVEVDFDE